MGRLFGAKLRMKADKECAEWLDKVNAKFGQIIECSDNTEIDLNHELHTLFEESAYQYVFYHEVLCLLNGEGLPDKAERALYRLATPLATIYEMWLKSDLSTMPVIKSQVLQVAELADTERLQ